VPSRGGGAARSGFLYQDLWTVEAALDVIDGDFTELIAEPHRDDGVGIDFILTKSSGGRIFHSAKLRQSEGNWTISRLSQEDRPGRSILGDLIAITRIGGIGVFCSGTSASDLKAVADHARTSDTWTDFEKRIGENQRIYTALLKYVVPICDDKDEALAALRSLYVRTKDEDELEKDIHRRIRTMFRRESQEILDSQQVRLLIADFVARRPSQSLTAALIRAHLDSHGYLPSQLAGDRTVETRLRSLNQTYMAELRSLLINGTEIIRHEAVIASENLMEHGNHVMLEGTAGTGKSCVLAQVLRQLSYREVPCLVVRLDQLQEGNLSGQSLGESLRLPESPAITLGEFASGQPCVLCFDQLDALSVVSARHQQIWGPFRELLTEAERYPNMRLLFACRKFDLEQDPRLRSLLTQHDQVDRVPIGPLDAETVQSVLEVSGAAAEPLSDEQIRMLAIPLNLYLFLEAGRIRPLDFVAVGDLFDAFWSHKAREVNRRVGQPPVWAGAIAALCKALSEYESLVVPQYVMDEHVEALEAMASDDVVRVSSRGVRFFHESFFDYAFARTFLGSNNDLVAWLVADTQQLFRRSQVRQILEFLRSREPDRRRYLRTLEGLLRNREIRFHIKKLVLAWMSELPDPTQEEWWVLEGLAPELGDHAWGVVRDHVPWFDLLHGLGRWEIWLESDDDQIERAVWLLGMPAVVEKRSAVVAELVGPFLGQSEKWRDRLRWLAIRGPGCESPEMQDLVIRLIHDGTLDDARPGFAANDDWWLIWRSTPVERPAYLAKVLGAWLDRQIARAADCGRDNPFRGEPPQVPRSQFSGQVIESCAKGDPRSFVRELLPRLARFERRVPTNWISAPSSVDRPDEQLRSALGEAMTLIARSAPVELDLVLDRADLPETTWLSALVMQAWSANPEVYADRIVRFILDLPVSRLCIGYGISHPSVDAFVAISRSAIAAASAHCSDDSIGKLVEAILHFAPDWESGTTQIGRTELALLRAVAPERLPDSARLRVHELEHRFPTAPERGAPAPPTEPDLVTQIPSPISVEVQSAMTDEEWLSAIAQYPDDEEFFINGQFVGGAFELSRGLEDRVREDPERFARLTERIPASANPTYFEAILRGLTYREGGDRPGTVMQVCAVVRRIERVGGRVSGAQIAHAIRTLADEEIPEDILDQLCRIAHSDTCPQTDEWQLRNPPSEPMDQAINSARGAAAHAISSLLFCDRNRWPVLRPTVERLACDPVLAVRTATVRCLLAVLDTNCDDALTCFQQLVDGAEAILGSDPVVQFVHYAMFRDYAAMKPVLRRMLQSPHSAVAVAGATQTAVAALSIDEASEDLDHLVQLSEEARTGVAKVCAANIADEALAEECERRLRASFADESQSVRKAASRCWNNLKPDQITTRGPLIRAFAQTLRPGDEVSVLLFTLQEAQLPLPAELCDLAERAVVVFGDRASSIRLGEGGDAHELSELMVRLYEETHDDALRTRALDSIDDMVRAGFIGIDDRLSERFHR